MPYVNQASSGGGAISGVTVTGAAVAGDAIIATSAAAGSWVFPPGHEFGYDQITSTVNIASTTEATGTTIITAAAHTFDGGAVMAEFFSPVGVTGTTLSQVVTISLFEAATQIGRIAVFDTPAAAQALMPIHAMLRFTPSAASHTYTITAFTTNVTGTPQVGAGAGGTGVNVPAYLRFTKV